MTIRNLHLNILLGLNSFIFFFLLSSDKIIIPPFLQVVGRMHPLLLHFPIVLLFLSWLVINFKDRLFKTVPSVQQLLDGLLFMGALSASLVVIMGLTLSKEGDYTGDGLQWHKWTGVGLSVIACILVWLQVHAYQKALIIGSNVSVVLLLLAGHFGANLTHGSDFLLAPLQNMPTKALDMGKAVVFDDAIYPILEAKCLGCHQADKPKGGLALIDSLSIAKGGKTGKLLDTASPGKSLLIERLSLDIAHKHHMPPKGKPQLTEEELGLIRSWISHGADFHKLVSALAPGDSLMAAIKAVYEIPEEQYDFEMADLTIVNSLSTPYRAIKPLADGSPALAVNFYGRSFYNAKSLSDMVPVAKQVVSLDLSAMPVSKDDVGLLIKHFSNLRQLNLNYTPTDDNYLTAISQLSKLQRISLSGTSITAAGVKKLLGVKTLREVFVWNTGVNDTVLAQLSKQYPGKRVEGGFKDDGKTRLRLTDPEVIPSRNFFRNQLLVSLGHPIRGTEIRYTLDGTEPDSLHAGIYKKPILITKNTPLRAKAFKQGWASSQEVSRQYMNSPIAPTRITLLKRPDYLYRGEEGKSFFDLESGGANHADGHWIGYKGSDLVAQLTFEKKVSIDTLFMSVLQNYAGTASMYIYPPEKIEIWGGPDSANTRRLGSVAPPLEPQDQVQQRRFIPCKLNVKDIRCIRIVAAPYHKIPINFPAAGEEAWLFLDEMIITPF